MKEKFKKAVIEIAKRESRCGSQNITGNYSLELYKSSWKYNVPGYVSILNETGRPVNIVYLMEIRDLFSEKRREEN